MGAPEQARLAQEFPKRCSCGKAYRVATGHDSKFHEWEELPFLGTRTDAFATFELRNCTCGSTLMAATQVHDLSAE